MPDKRDPQKERKKGLVPLTGWDGPFIVPMGKGQKSTRLHLLMIQYPPGEGVETRSLVVATSVASNPGPSIHVAAAAVATRVVAQLTLDPEHMTYIEHFDQGSWGHQNQPETWARVTFTWEDGQATNPQWSPLTPEQVRHALQTGTILE